MSTLDILLDLLEEDLEDSKQLVGSSPGPLIDPEADEAAAHLISAEQRIAGVLDLISNAGAADTNNLPSTLPSIANECLILARDAHTEALRPAPNNTLIGNKVKTIDRIIDVANGYRAKAGIT
ncbi:MAG: hypothetical protein L0219_19300 [Phycisphaerales bacterium]|nr:hypothetical protein [Phycisphaerales bacterium]MCI0674601.1 hypothetical protein [Phycisphaerales bacterium]